MDGTALAIRCPSSGNSPFSTRFNVFARLCLSLSLFATMVWLSDTNNTSVLISSEVKQSKTSSETHQWSLPLDLSIFRKLPRPLHLVSELRSNHIVCATTFAQISHILFQVLRVSRGRCFKLVDESCRKILLSHRKLGTSVPWWNRQHLARLRACRAHLPLFPLDRRAVGNRYPHLIVVFRARWNQLLSMSPS